uniref:Uncharacterized protein n=1 Tax=Globisporangium ultimum (strain ATCC 200006 / CBS 805.95 / DAOM BR144) TaxID=431595 RepID=K3WHH1_GLOUD
MTESASSAWWKQLYAQAAAQNPTDANADNIAQQFLTNVLAASSSQAAAIATSLREIGAQLLVPLPQLSATTLQKEQKLHRDVVLRVLQLQVICRLLCCCNEKNDSAMKDTEGESNVTAEKNSHRKKRRRLPIKQMKKEMRTLLDRIALLIDAANPPSITDDDERSRFHEFLQDVLAKAFATRVPKIVKYLLAVYELEEDEQAPTMPVNLIPTVRSASGPPPLKASTTNTPPPPAPLPVSQSILSALRDEQRPLKRSRTETATPFKKMELPRRSSFPSTRKDLLSAVAKTTAASSSSTSSSSASKRTTPRSKDGITPRSKDKKVASSSSSRSGTPRSSGSLGAPPNLKRGISSSAKPPPLLVRNITGPQSRFTPGAPGSLARSTSISQGVRPLFAPKTSPHSQKPLNAFKLSPHPQTLAVKPTGLAIATGPAMAPRTAVSALVANERASVVMRTPDRPRRRAARPGDQQTRVLIESSPPFRNQNVAAARATRKQSTIPPPLLR